MQALSTFVTDFAKELKKAAAAKVKAELKAAKGKKKKKKKDEEEGDAPHFDSGDALHARFKDEKKLRVHNFQWILEKFDVNLQAVVMPTQRIQAVGAKLAKLSYFEATG